MPYAIGPHVFHSLGRAQEHAQRILKRGTPEAPLAGSEFAFMRALLERHPNAARKAGAGVDSIFVRVNWKTAEYENRCFWLRRIDGSETDFSYTECIAPTDHRSHFLRAARLCIHYQIQEFRDAERARLGETTVCPLSGREFAIATSHVDHQFPNTFEVLIDRFISERSINIDDVEIISGWHDGIHHEFADSRLASSWKEFHRAHAVLRLLPAAVNSKISNAKF